jgi:hypothetical protein
MHACTNGDRGRPAEAMDPEYLATGDIARRFGKTTSCVWGWINVGVQTPSGQIRLAAIKVGGKWSVKPADLVEFIRLQNPNTHVELALRQKEEKKQAERDSRRLRKLLGKE